MTKTDWTKEEVRAVAKDVVESISCVDPLFKARDMLTAYAERIEADERAAPAVWANKVELQDQITRKAKPGCVYCIDAADHQTGLFTEPLFTRPPAQPAQEQPGWKVLPNGELVGALIVAEDASKRWNTRATPAQTVDIDRKEAAIELAVKYGGIDGAHHKDWVIDQMVRVLAGDDYAVFVAEAKAGEDGPDTYDWNEGIAP